MQKGLFKRIIAVLLVLLTAVLLPACVGMNDIPFTEPNDIYSEAETELHTEAEETEEETSFTEAPQTEAEAENKTKAPEAEKTSAKQKEIDIHGSYTSKKDVALFIHKYKRLPDNFITKKEAQSLGWSGGSLEKYAPGKCIGGDYFGNYQNLLPKASGRKYYECDIDTLGKSSRGAKRIIYSNDGLIFYTSDHYESFTQLY